MVAAMIGPPQYRINRGTALKWIDAMANTEWKFDPAQLSFCWDGEIYGSPEGILASIAEPNPALAWDGMSHLYDGEQFVLSNELRKRLKVKGTLPYFESFLDAKISIEYMLASFEAEKKQNPQPEPH